MTADSPHKIIYFSEDKIAGISLPERFTFPFYYEPDPLTILAAEELHRYLEPIIILVWTKVRKV